MDALFLSRYWFWVDVEVNLPYLAIKVADSTQLAAASTERRVSKSGKSSDNFFLCAYWTITGENYDTYLIETSLYMSSLNTKHN